MKTIINKKVARQKILQSHFSGESKGMQQLLDMELEILPRAITWIGKPTCVWKGTNVSGLSLMFNLMRRVPDLFDSTAQKKKSLVAAKMCES